MLVSQPLTYNLLLTDLLTSYNHSSSPLISPLLAGPLLACLFLFHTFQNIAKYLILNGAFHNDVQAETGDYGT